jgi:hypothetical protein
MSTSSLDAGWIKRLLILMRQDASLPVQPYLRLISVFTGRLAASCGDHERLRIFGIDTDGRDSHRLSLGAVDGLSGV